MIDPREFQPTSAPLGTGLTIALATCVLYLAVAWTSSGRTYGDHLLGLRVVGRQGDRVGFLRALVRAIFCVGFPVGLVSAMSSTSRRSVQDLVLRTDVIYDWASTHGRTDNGSPVTSSGPEGSGP